MNNLTNRLEHIANDVNLLQQLFGCDCSALELSSEKFFECLPDLPGIYLVLIGESDKFNPEDILYIGVSTISVRKRWAGHHKKPILKAIKRVCDRFGTQLLPELKGGSEIYVRWWVDPFIHPEHLRLIEDYFIKRFNPPLNRIGAGHQRDWVEPPEDLAS
jgi:hypothetical protein